MLHTKSSVIWEFKEATIGLTLVIRDNWEAYALYKLQLDVPKLAAIVSTSVIVSESFNTVIISLPKICKKKVLEKYKMQNVKLDFTLGYCRK